MNGFSSSATVQLLSLHYSKEVETRKIEFAAIHANICMALVGNTGSTPNCFTAGQNSDSNKMFNPLSKSMGTASMAVLLPHTFFGRAAMDC